MGIVVRCVIIRCVNAVEPCDVIGGFETQSLLNSKIVPLFQAIDALLSVVKQPSTCTQYS
jgi:hypothetical protein